MASRSEKKKVITEDTRIEVLRNLWWSLEDIWTYLDETKTVLFEVRDSANRELKAVKNHCAMLDKMIKQVEKVLPEEP